MIIKHPKPQPSKVPPAIADGSPKAVVAKDFPRILERIELMWGSIELHNYFHQILYVDRSDRQGFSMDVLMALGKLNTEHDSLLTHKGVIRNDIWNDRPYK